MAGTPTPQKLPSEIYTMFCAGIEQATAQKIVRCLTAASVNQVKHVHILFQSAGGYVGEGVFLYNLFRSMPIELTLYNVGQLSSAAVVAYLGAKRRKTSAHATFIITAAPIVPSLQPPQTQTGRQDSGSRRCKN